MIALYDIVDDEFWNRFNFSQLKCPSDQLSVGALRRVHPDLFDTGFFIDGKGKFERLQDTLEKAIADMVLNERLVAASAYADAKGITPPRIEMMNADDHLAELYIEYGIASGEHEAAELVKDIRRQGREMAKSRGR